MKRPIRVPWRDLAEVVLFDQYIAGRGFRVRVPHVGIRLRSGAQTTPTTWMERMSAGLMPHVPADVVPRSLPVNLWRLDERRLCEAVDRFVPDVRVVRLDEYGQPHPVVPA